MISEVLQDLVDHHLTTVRELAEITGRGESTVYRWLSRESQPNFEDMRTLARKLSNDHARRRLIDLFTSGLPVVVEWMDHADPSLATDSEASAEVAMDQSLAALDNLSAVLVQQRRMIQQGVTKETAGTTLPLINDTIRHLTASRNILMEQLPSSFKARPRVTQA